jgi:hypothetical protein
MNIISFPQWTPEARKRWEQVPEWARKEILNDHWCPHCRTGRVMKVYEGKMHGRTLIIKGVCRTCEGEMARVIEPEEE